VGILADARGLRRYRSYRNGLCFAQRLSPSRLANLRLSNNNVAIRLLAATLRAVASWESVGNNAAVAEQIGNVSASRARCQVFVITWLVVFAR